MLKPVFDQCLLEKVYVQGDFFTTTYDDMRENLSPLRSDRIARFGRNKPANLLRTSCEPLENYFLPQIRLSCFASVRNRGDG